MARAPPVEMQDLPSSPRVYPLAQEHTTEFCFSWQNWSQSPLSRLQSFRVAVGRGDLQLPEGTSSHHPSTRGHCRKGARGQPSGVDAPRGLPVAPPGPLRDTWRPRGFCTALKKPKLPREG